MTSVNPYSAPSSATDMGGDETYEPNLFSMSGRIGRLRYLSYSFVWGLILLAIVGGLMAISLGSSGMSSIAMLLLVIASLGSMVPMFSLAVRRLNDMNQSGWLSLLLLVPLVGSIFALVLIFAPGTKGENNYGAAPCENTALIVIGGLAAPVLGVLSIVAALSIPAYMGLGDMDSGFDSSEEFQFPE